MRTSDIVAELSTLTEVDAGSARVTVPSDLTARLDERDCGQCHGSGPDAFFERRPMYDGTGTALIAQRRAQEREVGHA